MELEEEKKAQAEWEKRVKEQAKKIENLSSMVLFSNRDESREHIKRVLLSMPCFLFNFLSRSLKLILLCFGYILQIYVVKLLPI